MAEEEKTAVELLLSEPEIVAWLDPGQDDATDGDDETPRAA